jgi:hypothetical protein
MDAGISDPVIVTDNRKREISLQEIEVEEGASLQTGTLYAEKIRSAKTAK